LANLGGLPKVRGKKEKGKGQTDKANQEIDFLGKGCGSAKAVIFSWIPLASDFFRIFFLSSIASKQNFPNFVPPITRRSGSSVG
jgi:hypothetical protein